MHFEQETLVIESSCVEETQAAAAALAGAVCPGDVIALDGDLGAGKTYFTQGLAAGLGISQAVSSPTFNVMVEYDEGRVPLYHFDLYRLNEPEELEDIAFYEYTEGLGVACVEWAGKFEEELPEDVIQIYISTVSATQRRLRIAGTGPVSAARVQEWARNLSPEKE